MSKTTACDDARSCSGSCTSVRFLRGGYCGRCHLLLGLDGVHVVAVEATGRGGLRVVVETPAAVTGCRQCGVLARARGRVRSSWQDFQARARRANEQFLDAAFSRFPETACDALPVRRPHVTHNGTQKSPWILIP